jgi:hypothetical protein
MSYMVKFRTNKRTGKVHPITPRTKSYASLHPHASRQGSGSIVSVSKRSSHIGSSKISYADAQRRHRDGRSLHAQVIDEALVARDQTPKTAENFSHWAAAMNRRDTEDIDVGNIGPGSVPRRPGERRRRLGASKYHGETTPPPTGEYEALGEHPITLVGGKEAVEAYQPIVDKRFKDLSEHLLKTERIDPALAEKPRWSLTEEDRKRMVIDENKPKVAIQVGEAGAGVSAYYEAKYDPRATSPSDAKVLPYRIVIDDDTHKTDYAEESMIHETSHLRRNIQKDARLKKIMGDKDSEEKETVHETSARAGEDLLKSSSNLSYYQYVAGNYPETRFKDLKTLDLHTKSGEINTTKIEKRIIDNQGKTLLNKETVSQKGHGRRINEEGKLQNKLSKKELQKRKNIDTLYVTSEGDIVHAYSPKGTINPKKFAKRVDAMDYQRGEESVYQIENGKRTILLKKRKGVR